MMRFLLMIILTAAMFSGSIAGAQEGEITEVAVHTPQWEEEGGGLYTETFQAVFEPLGIKVVTTFTPYEASIARVQGKEADVAMSAYRDEFPDVLYPEWPQEIEETIVVHLPGTPFTSARSLIGKRVGWIRGYGFEQHLPDGIEIVEVRKETLGMRQLDRGRIDFFIDYEPTVLEAAEEAQVDMTRFKMTRIRELSKPVYPMFRNDQRGRQIMAIYDRRMAELHADGSLAEIFHRNGNEVVPTPQAR